MNKCNGCEEEKDRPAQHPEQDIYDSKHYVHNIAAMYSDKLYVLNAALVDNRCALCGSFSTKMCMASCGHRYCLTCIYEDLASLSIAKCIYCFQFSTSPQSNYGFGGGDSTVPDSAPLNTGDKKSADNPAGDGDLSDQQVQMYISAPASDFMTPQQTIFLGHQIRMPTKYGTKFFSDAIFPVYDISSPLPRPKEAQQAAVVLCRFHEDISPLLSSCKETFPLTEGGIQRYYEHFTQCYGQNILFDKQQQVEAAYYEEKRRHQAQKLAKRIRERRGATSTAESMEPNGEFNSGVITETEAVAEVTSCDPALLTEQSTIKQHCIISNNTILMGNINPIGPASADCLPYSLSFYSTECRRLFKTETGSTASDRNAALKDIFTLLPNRNPFVGHIILKKLIFDIFEHEQLILQRDYWNCQVIFFINPYESISYWLFSNVTLGLQAEAPDGRCTTYEFIIDRENLYKHRILRFYVRILPFYEGRYTFTLKWSCSLPNAHTSGYTIFQSCEQISTFVTRPLLSPAFSPISLEASLGSNLSIHPALSSLLTVAQEVLAIGHRYISQYVLKTVKPGAAVVTVATADVDAVDILRDLRMLTPKDVEALCLYAAYCYTVKDASFFCIGCRAYALLRESAHMLATAAFLHALIAIMDRYPEVDVVQTPAVDLICTLGTTLPNFFSSTMIVGTSLLGRLRRIKYIFNNSNKQLCDLIYTISQRCYYVVPFQTSNVLKSAVHASTLTRLYINRDILDSIPSNGALTIPDAARFYLAALILLKAKRGLTEDNDLDIPAVIEAMHTHEMESVASRVDSKNSLLTSEVAAFYANERARLAPVPSDWKEYIMLHIVGYLTRIWVPSSSGLQILYDTLLRIVLESCVPSGGTGMVSVPSFAKLYSALSAHESEFINPMDLNETRNLDIVTANIEYLTVHHTDSATSRFIVITSEAEETTVTSSS